MSAALDTSRISPTAHYTAYVWFRHGLSHPALATRRGALMYQSARPLMAVSRRLGGPTLEQMLLRRHTTIDYLLDEAIASGRVTQVVEIAAGLSPRGMSFCRRHPKLTYVEGDLPDMAGAKRRVLDDAGLRRDGHHVVPLNALAHGGDHSLREVARGLLDPGAPTAIVTEGLLNYFDRGSVEAMWERFAALFAGRGGLYLADLHLQGETLRLPAARAFAKALGVFARGAVHMHYADEAEARRALLAAGFTDVKLPRPEAYAHRVSMPEIAGGDVLRIVVAGA